jgi:hypothetical protein
MNFLRLKKETNNLILFNIIIICSGYDLSAIEVNSISIRLAWIFLIFFIYHLIPTAFTIYELIFIKIFIGFHLVSALISNSLGGIYYSIWIFFNFIFFYKVSQSFAKLNSPLILERYILINGRLQITSSVILFLTGVQERGNFIYYEPSYMALALIPYVSVCFFSNKTIKSDFLLIFTFIVVSQSVNFIIILAFVFFIYNQNNFDI